MKIRLIGLIRLIGRRGFLFGVVWAVWVLGVVWGFWGVGQVWAVETGQFVETVHEPSLRYLHTDHLGSVAAVSDERGEKVWEGRYLPYGDRGYQGDQGNQVQRGFTGQERDYETNLYNYNARLYNPKIGQFVSADMAGTSPAATGLNRFAYVRNNPLRFTDPSGNAFEHGDGGGGDYFPELPEELEADYYYSGGLGLKASTKKRKEMALAYIEDVAVAGLSHPGLAPEAIERIKTVLGNVGAVVLDRNDPRYSLGVAFQADEKVKGAATTMNIPIFFIGSVSIIFMPPSDTLADPQNYLYALSHESYHALSESEMISMSKLTLYGVPEVLGYSALLKSYMIEGEIEAHTYSIQISNKAGKEELTDWSSFYLNQLKQQRLGVVTPWDKLIFWLTRGMGERLEEEYNIK